MKTVGQDWDEFRTTVVAPNAPRVQAREMQSAFYAGAAAVLSKLKELENLPEDAIVGYLNSLTDECRVFAINFVKDATRFN